MPATLLLLQCTRTGMPDMQNVHAAMANAFFETDLPALADLCV